MPRPLFFREAIEAALHIQRRLNERKEMQVGCSNQYSSFVRSYQPWKTDESECAQTLEETMPIGSLEVLYLKVRNEG